MAVPNFQEFMLPLLTLAGDGAVHSVAEAIDLIANELALTQADRAELLPSGRQTRLANRVHWARAHLKAAGLLEAAGRGKFKITDAGRAVLEGHPSVLSMKFLEQFPGYIEFRTPKGSTSLSGSVQDMPEATPEEALETSYDTLRKSLAQELLDRVKAATPAFFEQLVVDVLVAMGYGGSRQDAGEALGQSGDEGVDGVIREDKLGLDLIYLQAKRWQAPVGRPVVQAFVGSLEGFGARKGVMITTSSFTAEARGYVAKIERRVVLIDGEHLAQLMIDHDVGVSPLAVYRLKRVDEDFFEDEVPSLAEAGGTDEGPAEVAG